MYKAGFSGHDAMRANAEKLLGHELRAAKHPALSESMSSPAHTEMRPFKKGGHAVPRAHHAKHSHGKHRHEIHGGGHTKHHGLTHEQTDMHIPKRAKSAAIKKEKFEKVEHFKKGGHVPHKAGGGLLGGILGPIGGLLGLKKGGHAHKKHEHESHEMMHERKEKHALKKMQHEMNHLSEMGKHERARISKKHHKACGGHMTMEDTMRGSMKSGHDDLRGSKGGVTNWPMRGEQPIRKARGGHISMESTMHDKVKAGHQNLRGHLGGVTQYPMRGEHGHHAKPQHFAIGGVGKIRHEQMTPAGKQKTVRRTVKHG